MTKEEVSKLSILEKVNIRLALIDAKIEVLNLICSITKEKLDTEKINILDGLEKSKKILEEEIEKYR